MVTECYNTCFVLEDGASVHSGVDGAVEVHLATLLDKAVAELHARIPAYEQDGPEEEDLSIPADPDVRNYSFTSVDGKLYFRIDSRMEPVDLPLTTENRVRGMMALRDCARQLIAYQMENHPDKIIRREQEKLGSLYDAYVRKYGRLYTRGNNLAFSDDSSYPLLCSLEVLDNEGNFARKADMFTKRTIRPHEPVTQVDTASEAQPFQSDKFPKTPHNTSVGILFPGEFLTALRNGNQFKMRVGGDEGSMENTSRHSVSG